MLIHGSCHCGNLSFKLLWEPDPRQIEARRCGCSFCMRHGGIWTSNPDSVLTVKVHDTSAVSSYRFGTQTAEFQVCSRCGVVPLVTSRIEEHVYAVVNVNTFDDSAKALLHTKPASFDDESEQSRLARRKRNWIAHVRYVH